MKARVAALVQHNEQMFGGAVGNSERRTSNSEREGQSSGSSSQIAQGSGSKLTEVEDRLAMYRMPALSSKRHVDRAVAESATPILGLKREFAKGFAGSPAFIAPEVIKGEPAKGYSSDWYSLGVCIFRLACG